jgi:hypothetical protein
MPRFHLRRGAASGVSSADMAGPVLVVVLAVAAGGCSFRQGIFMAGSRSAGGQAQELVEQRRKYQVQVREIGVLVVVTTRTRSSCAPSRGRRCIRARPIYPCTGQTRRPDDMRWALHVHSGCGGVGTRCKHEERWCARGVLWCGERPVHVVHIAAISRFCTLTYTAASRAWTLESFALSSLLAASTSCIRHSILIYLNFLPLVLLCLDQHRYFRGSAPHFET